MQFIDGMVNQQAAMIAYIDDFYMMMWVTLAAVPLVFFMSKADLTRGGSPNRQAADIPH